MGQFGPTYANNRGFRRFSDSGLYAIGALISSTLFLLMVDMAGKYFQRAAGERPSIAAAVGLAGLLMLIDGVRLWGGRSTSLGPRRQTPYDWRLKGGIGVFGWGFDTGLGVSTVRATSLPTLGVILTATGHSTWFGGLFYGFGLAVGVWAGLLRAPAFASIAAAMTELQNRRRLVGPVRMVVVPSALTTAALAAVLLLSS